MKMKFNNTFPTLLALLVMMSCSQEKEVDEGKIVFRNDLAYEVNSTKPFTGCELFRNSESKNCYKNGKRIRKEYYHSNGQLFLIITTKTEDDGRKVNVLEKCFYYNGQTCWDNYTYLDEFGREISVEEFNDWYIDQRLLY